MSFLWPTFLFLLLTLPLLTGLYVWLWRRKRQQVVTYASLSLIKQAMTPRRNWRRHLPAALLLLALAALLLAAARPMARIALPTQQETIMLAIDVSGSMRATDVQPSRLEAAQAAARAFLAELPRHVKVGIVAFAGSAQIAQLPTTNREDLNAAIDRFQLQRGTATGNGIVLSLAALFPDSGIDLGQLAHGRYGQPRGMSLDASPAIPPPAPVAPGSYGSAAVILLTDGQRTTGVDPLEAAKLAADRGVRVYTVGVGTVEGVTIGFEGWSMHARLDEESLKGIAKLTHGEYFHAASAEALTQVYENLSSRLTVEKKETEITALLALLGALLVMASATLSMLWFHRVA
ncbi:ABC transporter ATP-binding protein [Hylemonella gracilis str. Niagara R]|uniref:ABC transporter ATP-binding protein n=1 Tax=Hylemonella gracilis str. Niagara R TaxID=1458275 RepID=A0A016XJF1_9BURK|nr:VWA domain-containing protein [Hylemonella gracilis]EYC52219.1 ABC transporter ATP-binding protein [Hylemonella gracilis str. Niagara R]